MQKCDDTHFSKYVEQKFQYILPKQPTFYTSIGVGSYLFGSLQCSALLFTVQCSAIQFADRCSAIELTVQNNCQFSAVQYMLLFIQRSAIHFAVLYSDKTFPVQCSAIKFTVQCSAIQFPVQFSSIDFAGWYGQSGAEGPCPEVRLHCLHLPPYIAKKVGQQYTSLGGNKFPSQRQSNFLQNYWGVINVLTFIVLHNPLIPTCWNRPTDIDF